MPDFHLINHYSFYTVTPQTETAKSWADKNLADAQRLGNNIYVESRYMDGLVQGILNDGLTVK